MRRTLIAIVAVLLVAAAIDARRTPSSQFMTRAAVGGIHLYQATLSKWYARVGVQCRFTPTCSHYGEAVVRQFGAVRGGWMAMKRVMRCGPWTPMGTREPPPTATS
jgi:putative membrane protein insertion efficiency factor